MKELDDDRLAKRADITAIEAELAGLLARTPYVLLLGIPGINVVSAAEFAGEMGPIKHYRSSRAITGRAGMYPARYQSDAVDRPDGKLVRRANRRLRRAIMMIADNLIEHNDHFRILAAGWRAGGQGPARHPRPRGRAVLPDRLPGGGRPRDLPPPQRPGARLRPPQADAIRDGTWHRPPRGHEDPRGRDGPAPRRRRTARRRRPLAGARSTSSRRSGDLGSGRLGEILPAVLVKLGVKLIQSEGSGEADRT